MHGSDVCVPRNNKHDEPIATASANAGNNSTASEPNKTDCAHNKKNWRKATKIS